MRGAPTLDLRLLLPLLNMAVLISEEKWGAALLLLGSIEKHSRICQSRLLFAILFVNQPIGPSWHGVQGPQAAQLRCQ